MIPNPEYVPLSTRPEHEMNIRPPRNDIYQIEHFTEKSDPAMAHLAWEIHATGYRDMGFVSTDAVTENGYLNSSIDKARGDNVEYYVAIGDEASLLQPIAGLASLRKVHIPEGGTLFDLPAYGLTLESLYENERLALERHPRVKEISALSRTLDTKPLAVFELIRDVIQNSWGKDEAWLYSIVSTTFDSLQSTFGDKMVRQIGAPVLIHDERVNDHIKLVPAITYADQSIMDIYRALEGAKNPMVKRRLTRSMLFLADGLRDDELGDDLASVCGEDVRRKIKKR